MKAGNFWNNKLSNIDGWECFIYDKMTKTDKTKKDRANYQYYRYYNDGDFPKGLKTEEGNPVRKWTSKETIETILERNVYKNAVYFIKKYMTAENRKEFYIFQETSILKKVMRAFDEMSTSIDYWAEKSSKCKKAFETIKEKYIGLTKLNKEFCESRGKSGYCLLYVLDNIVIDAETEAFFKKEYAELKYNFIVEYNKLNK